MRLRLRVAIRNLVNTLEPFVYSVCSLIHSLKLICLNAGKCSVEEYEKTIFLLSVIGGYSLMTLVRMYVSSYGRCRWYMLSLSFLSVVMLDGILYWLGFITNNGYPYVALFCSFVAMIFAIMFISTRNIISELKRIGRSSSL